MRIISSFLVMTLFLLSCSDASESNPDQQTEAAFITSADVSFLPLLESTGVQLYDADGHPQHMITTLKNAGCNTIRLRLWHNPSDTHSSFDEVKTLSQRIHDNGLKVWLSVHYSDTWADPGQQQIPSAWQGMDFNQLKAEVTSYTSLVLEEIKPDIIQIGNETNSGFLWPHGHLINNESQFLELISTAAATVRSQSPETKIMLHFAGTSGAEWFFSKVNAIDFDYAGLSYYPIWHGSDLQLLQETIDNIGQQTGKKVLIAETAYPFSLGWNDWTNNIVGTSEQLVPGYPATPQGQLDFMLAIKSLLKNSESGIGFSYWGGEWTSFMGSQASNGSTWENQALYDFENHALPVMAAFNPQ